MKKTNAARILDQHNIGYELVEYDVDEADLSAIAVARKLGQDVEQVFKTLVMRGDKTAVFVVVIPGNAEVDLKKAARLSGNKYAEMVAMKELLPLTGYIRGGCTSIGMKKQYQTIISDTAKALDKIYVSGGKIGSQLKLRPDDLCKAVNAKYRDIIIH